MRRGVYVTRVHFEPTSRRHPLDCLALLSELQRPNAVVSHASAARLWGVPVRRDLLRPWRLTDPTAWRRGRDFLMTQAPLRAEDVVIRRSLRLTSPARTLVDCARVGPGGRRRRPGRRAVQRPRHTAAAAGDGGQRPSLARRSPGRPRGGHGRRAGDVLGPLAGPVTPAGPVGREAPRGRMALPRHPGRSGGRGRPRSARGLGAGAAARTRCRTRPGAATGRGSRSQGSERGATRGGVDTTARRAGYPEVACVCARYRAWQCGYARTRSAHRPAGADGAHR
jgi:hypothetical protein